MEQDHHNSRVSEIIQLIDGEFTPVEAADVLLSLVAYKIKFHNLQLLNLELNPGISKEQSKRRIAELKQAKHRITKMIIDARNSGASLEINSNICINLIDGK
ncbi:MAG: hypothetical protein ACFB0A_00390 [Croceivirga sp.]